MNSEEASRKIKGMFKFQLRINEMFNLIEALSIGRINTHTRTLCKYGAAFTE